MIDNSKDLMGDALNFELKDTLSFGKLGFEKESLRVFQSNIAKSAHPRSVGSALCNQYITTDFSEAQLELITPPLSGKTSSFEFLDHIHHFVSHNIGQEILWPFSMPPVITSEHDIPIANFGTSNLGLFKQIYRNGLAHRYGRAMQAISGVHYNYSLPDSIWQTSLFKDEDKRDIKEIKSKAYFRMLRNVYRMNWLILYLFGASPVLAENCIKKDKSSCQRLDDQTYYLPYATSLRMSDYGYQNLLRTSLNISFNSLNDYIFDLRAATSTASKAFQKIDNKHLTHQKQINANVLQIEDEYYAAARAKSRIISNQRPTSKLIQGGVDYIELRSLDLNPFSRIGIDMETVYFLEMFLIYCLLKPSKPISSDELSTIHDNDLLVAKFGRDPNLYLQKYQTKIGLKEWGNQILDEITPIAELLDGDTTVYSEMIGAIKLKVNNPDETLSGLLLDRIMTEKISFIDLGNSIGAANKQYYLNLEKSGNLHWHLLEQEAKDSWDRQFKLEEDTSQPFENFVTDYFNE